MVPNSRSAETLGNHAPLAPKRKRNRKPCFACARKKTRCKLISPRLCEKCQKEGRSQCLPHISWQETIRATAMPVCFQQTPVYAGSSATPLTSLESTEVVLPHTNNRHDRYTYEGPPLQQSFLSASPNAMPPHYPNGIPFPDSLPLVDAESGQKFYPSAMLPANPNFNGLVNYAGYTHRHIAPHPPSDAPRMASSPQAGPAAASNLSSHFSSGSYSHTEYAIGMDIHGYASGSGLGNVPNAARFDAA